MDYRVQFRERKETRLPERYQRRGFFPQHILEIEIDSDNQSFRSEYPDDDLGALVTIDLESLSTLSLKLES